MIEVCGHFGIALGAQDRGLVQDLVEGRGGRFAVERSLASRHLVQHDSQGEDIRAAVEFPLKPVPETCRR